MLVFGGIIQFRDSLRAHSTLNISPLFYFQSIDILHVMDIYFSLVSQTLRPWYLYNSAIQCVMFSPSFLICVSLSQLARWPLEEKSQRLCLLNCNGAELCDEWAQSRYSINTIWLGKRVERTNIFLFLQPFLDKFWESTNANTKTENWQVWLGLWTN